MTIWYVVYCSIQKEQEFLRVCQRHIGREALEDAFVFTYDRMRRYEGAWHLEQQRMFPGYVFLESGDGAKLVRRMKEIPYLKEVLAGNGPLVPLEEREELFLRRLCGEGHHFGMSRGYIQDGRTFVTDGPLCGQEQLIRKIDRHKRIAQVGMPEDGMGYGYLRMNKENARNAGTDLEAPFPEGFRELQMGLEIVAKS